MKRLSLVVFSSVKQLYNPLSHLVGPLDGSTSLFQRFWAAAPKQSPVEHRGTFVHLFVGLSVYSFVSPSIPCGPLRPEICPIRPEICPNRPEICPVRQIQGLRGHTSGLEGQISGLRGQILGLTGQILGLR